MWTGRAAGLLAILTVGFLLRVWGIDFGLPHEYCRPDETILMYRALSIGAGDFNPHFFNYPSLQFYFVAVAIGLAFLIGQGLGYFIDVTDLQRLLFVDPTFFYIVGRSLTVLFGTSSIALVYSIGSRLESRRVGFASAALFAVAFLHVRDSHFLTVDVPATFWVLAAYAFACRYIERESLATVVLAGVCIGLAASTKYNAALFAPSILLATLVTSFPVAGVAGSRLEVITTALKAKWKHLVAVAGAAAASFVAGSPFTLLEPTAFVRDLSFERTMFAVGRGLDLGLGWIYHLKVSLWSGLGWPLLLAALAGCVFLAVRRRPIDIVLVSGIVAYYAVAGSGRSVFVRYMVPLIPLLCVAAAAALVRATSLLRGRWWLPVATCLLAAPSLSSSVQLDRILSRQDTRLMAAQWIEKNVPSGTRVALAGTEYGYPRIRRTLPWKQKRLADLQMAGEPARRLETELRIGDMAAGPVYDTVELRGGNPQSLRSVWTGYSVQVLQDSGVTWVVTQEHPLPFSLLPSGFTDGLKQLATPLQTFDPFVQGEPLPDFDPIDAFYVPFSGLSAVERPGPILRIFRLDSNPSAPEIDQRG